MVGATEEEARGRVRWRLWRLLKGVAKSKKRRNLDLFTAIFSSSETLEYQY